MEIENGTMISNSETDAFVQKEALDLMRSFFLPDGASGKDFKDPLANPLYADPKGLPPMYLSAGGYETLLDNSTKFAEMAKKAGVSVELDIEEGMQHVYPYMAGRHETADKTLESIGKWVNKQFGK
jgi:monoterpene epsilon-lactone hydrolase